MRPKAEEVKPLPAPRGLVPMTQDEKDALFSLPGMRGNSPGVSSHSQRSETMDNDEQRAQRAAADEERKRIAEESAREATRQMLMDSL
eukprot:5152885-Pyramimonas_sp.AAC.1